jgi:YXWGXW repeat-containing protein
VNFHRLRKSLLVALAAIALSACVAYVPAGPEYAYDGYVGYAPPPDRVEVIPAIPGPAYVWTPGFWAWGGGAYAWRSGRWVVPPHGYRSWQSGRWERHDRGHVWRPGHWR